MDREPKIPVPDAVVNNAAAPSRARISHVTIRELRAAGFASPRALADELNRLGVVGPRGGKWHPTSVIILARLGLVTGNGRDNNRLALMRAADARAEALAATIRKLRKAGLVSLGALARELNERQLPAARGGKWQRSSVSQLLQRLERLERRKSRRSRETPNE